MKTLILVAALAVSALAVNVAPASAAMHGNSCQILSNDLIRLKDPRDQRNYLNYSVECLNSR